MRLGRSGLLHRQGRGVQAGEGAGAWARQQQAEEGSGGEGRWEGHTLSATAAFRL